MNRYEEKVLILTIFVIILIVFCFKQQPVTVKVIACFLQGAFEDGLTIYRGIPFAAPPVCELRWRAPQAVLKWCGVR